MCFLDVISCCITFACINCTIGGNGLSSSHYKLHRAKRIKRSVEEREEESLQKNGVQ